MKIFSPSQTSDWSFCPVYWWLGHEERWRPRRLGDREGAAMVGSAVAKGLDVWNKGIITHAACTTAEQKIRERVALLTAKSDLFHAWETLVAQGFILEDLDRETLMTRVAKAMNGYLAHPPLPIGWTLLESEFVLENGGNARPDLIFRDADGGSLGILDYKVKMSLQARYHEGLYRDYLNDFKMLHYVHFYGEHMKEPVPRYYICVIILEPVFTIKLIPYTVHPESLEFWRQTAEPAWQMMEEMRQGARLWASWIHATKFGPCPMLGACFDHHLDEGLMAKDYVRRPAHA